MFVNLHKLIEEYANHMANHIQHGRSGELINYPPNGGLTDLEKNEISKIGGNEVLKGALRKILASNTADVLFSFFNYLDGTADPDFRSEKWTEVMLVDYSEENEIVDMLHDEFYSTYWEWKKKRINTNWKLDLLEE